ncbi:MAG TPA: SMC family ATPase, partial [Blastocatellia bacterium]|nr:SMC family ATPase [Blastocatellia bacterium]
MQIIKVELKNIKNHADATFEFGPGVVAICGPNGAGKTTILEAIAWTLFDHLSYTRENFLKRGEKRGSVRVTFISQDDGREYEVFRDTAGAYNVYDPRLKMKIVEQKAQVSKWLRQHLGVEPGTDLATLFRTTIGVPQGTFTVDFAESVAKRKPTFDKILKVEEYQRSAELMKDVSRLIEKKLAEVREQIAGAEGELKRYDEVASEMNKMQSQLTDIESQLSGAIGERDRNQIEFAEFDSLKSQLDQLRNDVERLSFKFEQEEKQRLNIAAEFARAQTAADSVQRTAAGYEQYLAARDRLSALSADRSQRDKLRSELTKIETAIIRTQSELQNLSRQLSEIEVAKRETYELTPKIVQQESLESKRSELQRMAGQRQTLEDSLKEFDKELVLLRSRYAETSRQIEETEKLEASAEQVKQLEEDVAAKEAV